MAHYSCLETVPPINTMSASNRRTALTIGGPEDKALRANTNDRNPACSTALTPARRGSQFWLGLQKEHRWRAAGLPRRDWYGEQVALAQPARGALNGAAVIMNWKQGVRSG